MKKYKEKFRYLDARLKISFVAFCILAFLLVLCLDREWIFSEGLWKIAMIFLGAVSGIYISMDLETIQKADQSGTAFFRWLYITGRSDRCRGCHFTRI